MTMEIFITGTGQRLLVHNKMKCKGRHCCIHNPSNHHMVNWPLYWRVDRKFFERIDSEGVGHPDPDEIEYHKSIYKNDISIHGCNGACNNPNKTDNNSIDWKEELKYFLNELGHLEEYLKKFEEYNNESFDQTNRLNDPTQFILSAFDWVDYKLWDHIDEEWNKYYIYWKD